MAKRKRATKLRKPKTYKDLPLAKTFDCPSCFHKDAVYVEMKKKDQLAILQCIICAVRHEMTINHLDAPIDVYTDWMDKVNKINEQERQEERAAKRQKRAKEREEQREKEREQQQRERERETQQLEEFREPEQRELDLQRERQQDAEEEEEFARMMGMLPKPPNAEVERSSQPRKVEPGNEAASKVQEEGVRSEGTELPATAKEGDKAREGSVGKPPISSDDVAPVSMPPLQKAPQDENNHADELHRQKELDEEENELERELDLEENEQENQQDEQTEKLTKEKADSSGDKVVAEKDGDEGVHIEKGKQMGLATTTSVLEKGDGNGLLNMDEQDKEISPHSPP